MLKVHADPWEWIVVAAIVLILIASLLPHINRAPEKAREAEVKSNVHAIQIALERYAVDTGGYYPYILYGGDVTDTFVHPHAPISSDTGLSYYFPPNDPDYEPYPGDFDALIVYGYIAEYPSNPFAQGGDIVKFGRVSTNPAENGFGPLELTIETTGSTRTNAWGFPRDRGTEYVRRNFGGINGKLMWDVSEGQRHPPWPIFVVPDPQPHYTGFVNPQYSAYEVDHTVDYRDDHQFYLTPGNFYYYAVFREGTGYASFGSNSENLIDTASPQSGPVLSYKLAGYGTIKNYGSDAYNLWGDFEYGSLSTRNNEDGAEIDDVGHLSGPDGRRDGVVIVVEGGASVVLTELNRHYTYPGATPGPDFVEFENFPNPGHADTVFLTGNEGSVTDREEDEQTRQNYRPYNSQMRLDL